MAKTCDYVRDFLWRNGFSRDYADELMERLGSKFPPEQMEDRQLVTGKLADLIGEDLRFCIAGDADGTAKPRVVAVVGPTGSGKTSCIAKMVANSMWVASETKHQAPVFRLVTTDGMRVASKEKLERLVSVLGLDVDTAYSGDDLAKLMAACREPGAGVDCVFIDTSGVSPRDGENSHKLRDILGVPELNADVYLTVPATMKYGDLEQTFDRYEPFGYRSVIVTKCDETESFGNVLSVLHKTQKPVSWITNGQEILHTLRRASPKLFREWLSGFYV